MEDTLVLILKEEEINFLQKDGKVVDSYNDLCIMPYLQAAQLESSHKNHYNTKLIGVKELFAADNKITNDFITRCQTFLCLGGQTC